MAAEPAPDATAASTREPAAASRGVLVTLGLVAFTYAFQQMAVLPAIPTIEHAFHTSQAWSTWLLSGYLMVATVVTPAFGRLGDLHGQARVLLLSLVVFLLGSVGAATLPGLPALLVCRAAQGVGGAVLPLAFALTRRHVDDPQVGRAIAGLTGAFGLGAVLGFATGGWMAQAVSWRLLFGAGAALVTVGIVLLLRTVPRPGGSATGGFDLGGALWLGATSLGVLLALTLGQQLGWASPVPGLLLAASVAAAWRWVRAELHHEHPLIDLRVLRDRTVLFVNVGTVGLGWGRFVGLLLIPLLVSAPAVHGGFGADATVAGLYLVPDGVGTMVGGPGGGWLTRRVRPGLAFAAGLVGIAAGASLVAVGLGSPALILAGTLLLGVGGGVATQASSAVTTRDVPPEAAGASSSLNSTVRRFSGGVAGQVSTVIVAVAGGGAASSSGFAVAFAVAAGLTMVGAGFSAVADRSSG